ncbi:hypothetical protein A2276_02190 [candidate division WOR-1 bacterium RIFOXYA12_FULL_43_27]|uniref:Uncharacterized protein n=1 Tax=candidate division WOR-1 bacterium RIFOXYC2_FULL_46_14 TaxID=1802587 RepID=A0A1F4U7Y4_UNCSA|nr:MAG: hypothetical protein A2276_02190 [candidate division WOR-1 bacterium RIFOXYA12_FULL_43_27]OGC19471.1 MAG: hypothetical protein A2292_02140 [candidate division WOR-1 bacterium RIFOXYB2_FULL_46_45]OGC30459.1 MAG: hypothetical protein A2232_02140 [candidate division WOR-1 bacterium RIFOXYA2_FULL_46_56]OGC41058.1 MAG: hypothetical protein A2438_02135 [candidate division WOR-1 bacterium RIFOXYC2_FULL_46_14]
MTHEELNSFLDANPQIEWAKDDDGNFYFRHSHYDSKHEKVKVEPRALANISAQQLEKTLVGGRNVDQITRVTGYFSRVSGWNKGKLGELNQRERVGVI